MKKLHIIYEDVIVFGETKCIVNEKSKTDIFGLSLRTIFRTQQFGFLELKYNTISADYAITAKRM